jgi:hypothetical protein
MASAAEGAPLSGPPAAVGMTESSEGGAVPPGLNAAEKRAALTRVLETSAFLRAGQLCNFLRYISEMEAAGRAAELSEYVIGVEALGRPPGYSTADDSSVRRRAHALRQKLEEVYAAELAGERVRIELPKGSYVPRFVRVADPVVPALGGESRDPAADASRGKRVGWRMLALGSAAFLGGVIVTALVLVRPGTSTESVDPVLREAWGPLAKTDANVLICLSTPPHLVVLPYPEGPLPRLASLLPSLPAEPALREWYRLHYPLEPTHALGIHKTSGAIHLGDVNGLVAVVRTLDRMRVGSQIVAEKNMGLPALRGRNMIFIGNPEYSFAAAKLLDTAAWTVAYDPSERQRVVTAREPAARAVATYRPARDSQGWLTEVYGLITVQPSAGATEANPSGTAIFSCSNDSGCQAALEFFSTASQMQRMRERFQAEGLPGFPPWYQVVVRCRVQSGQTISADYADHLVLR